MGALKKNYEITDDWKGEKYIGITLDWDYERRQVHLSMPGYVKRALQQFNHPAPSKRQNSPYPNVPIKYGATKQYATTRVDAPAVSAADKKIIQQVCGKFLFYGRAVDSTILTAISAIASKQATPTTDTLAKNETTTRLSCLPRGSNLDLLSK